MKGKNIKKFQSFILTTVFIFVFAFNAVAKDSETKEKAHWDNGFLLQDQKDENDYKLRIRAAIQFRYSYLKFNDYIISNAGDEWNNFSMRRLRLFVDGHAPDKGWKYYMHIQLEPKGAVNVHDAFIQWQKVKFFRIQFGRMKIPYGLEYWQSGFAQNGVERTIFTAETEVDGKAKDIMGNTLSPSWPGSNANFPVSGHYKDSEETLFPVGGLMIYRSQGINVNGEIPFPGLNRKSKIDYWIGVFNGRDTQGAMNSNDEMLVSARVAYHLFVPVPLKEQGDMSYSKSPKLALLGSWYKYRDKATKRYDSSLGAYVDDYYLISDYGYNAALAFRFYGVSLDLEYGYEEFKMHGKTSDNNSVFDRQGYRANLGAFLLPKTIELVFKYAVMERIKDNNKEKSLQSGLGLVTTTDGIAIERELVQYTCGINFYLHNQNQKIAIDFSYLVRNLKRPLDADYNIKNQEDNRIRVMYQHFY